MFKKCSTCLEEKNISEFRKDKRRNDGLQSWCKVCARKYHKSAYMARYGDQVKKRSADRYELMYAWVKEYKELHGCKVCSEGFFGCLEFHHLDPNEKEFTVTSSLNRNIEAVKKEMEKCVVICSNCHKKLHAGLIILPPEDVMETE